MGKHRIRRIAVRWFFIIVPCFALLVWQCLQMRPTTVQFLDKQGNVQVLSLSVREKKQLFDFMRLLFAEDSFAYTLLGAKPVAWACYITPFPFIDFPLFAEALTEYHRILRSGWEVWSKYSHFFPAVTFWKESSTRHLGGVSLLIVNKDRFNDVILNNKQDFQNVLGREIQDGFQLLQEAKARTLIDEVLGGHQALIGMILGYGKSNSWEFLERVEKREPTRWVWEGSDQESQDLQESTDATELERSLSIMSCPSFAGNPSSEESLALKKEYLLTKERVLSYYKNRDFLEATLSLLAGFRPKESPRP